jgi:hypothetical protein
VQILALGSGSGSPSAAPAGVWSRFRYVPALRGCVYADPYGNAIWFIRTSA